MPTASVVRSSQATPARRHGHPCAAINPAAFHLSSPVSCSNRWGHFFAAQLRQAVPSIDPEEATGLAFACGAHTLLLAPEEAADVIADLLQQTSDVL